MAKRLSKINICKQCGKEFHPFQSNPNQKYCCMECYGDSKVKEFPLKTCEICGEQYRRSPADEHSKYGHSYCSPKCRAIGNGIRQSVPREKVKLECKYCGKVEYKYLKPHEYRRTFCNTTCSNLWYSKNKIKRKKGWEKGNKVLFPKPKEGVE